MVGLAVARVGRSFFDVNFGADLDLAPTTSWTGRSPMVSAYDITWLAVRRTEVGLLPERCDGRDVRGAGGGVDAGEGARDGADEGRRQGVDRIEDRGPA